MLRPMDDVVNAIGKEVWYHELLDWLHWDDHYWAVPMTWGTDMFLYRKDLAQEKGLTQFKTWDDWLKYAQATNDAPKRYGCTLAGNASLWFNEDVYELSGATAAICGTMRAIPPLPTMLSMARWSSTATAGVHAAGLAQPRLWKR